MIEEVYTEYREFYSTLEVAYGYLKLDRYEWESMHLRYFIYYLRKYDIQSMEYFTSYHYKVSYRGYLEEMTASVLV
ncbi:Competence positive regulator ComW [Streptococcus sp. DD10]|nr:Competence positive regulator ComW [Streptococcus sp. DD10]